MKYLIKLARFVSKQELRYINSKLVKKFSSPKYRELDGRITGTKSRRIYIETQKPIKNHLLGEIKNILGVWQIIELYFTTDYRSVQEVVAKIHKFLVKQNRELLKVSLETYFHHGARFHELAFKQRFNSTFSEINISSELLVDQHYYLEATPTKYTFGKFVELQAREDLQDVKLSLLLLDPYSKREIADFIRLGVVFQTPVFICYDHQAKKTVQRLLEGAKKMVRGWQKTTIAVSDFHTASANLIPIGFSMWSNKDSQNLIDDIHNRLVNLEDEDLATGAKKNKELKLGFVFGNERHGLDFKVRKALHHYTYWLGPHSSEPLKASQAAAYALGVLYTAFS